MQVSFDVEHAGCESCAGRIQSALSRFAEVESVAVDGEADLASVVLAGAPSRRAVDSALQDASVGAGHEYRVRDDSWHTRS